MGARGPDRHDRVAGAAVGETGGEHRHGRLASAAQPVRLDNFLARALPRSYRARLVLVVLGCTLLPALGFAAWVLADGAAPRGHLVLAGAILLVVAVAGIVLTLLAIDGLLRPLHHAVDVLERYRRDQRLPPMPATAVGNDEVERLLHGIHRCLHAIDVRYRELERRACEDPLTQAMNRRGAQGALQASVQRARKEGGGFMLFVVDLDNLKSINDVHGHASGDRALAWLVQCARECCLAEGDWIGRWGGDEFLVGMHADPSVARDRIDVWIQVLAQPRQHAPAVRVSVGAVCWEPGLDDADLYSRADAAMYAAKSAGGLRIVMHTGAGDGRETHCA